MSTSDQNGHGQLTRKQLRELRLTGSTPVISEQDAASTDRPEPEVTLPRAAEPVVFEPVVESTEADDQPGGRLTRRQAREQERLRTASTPVLDGEPIPVQGGPDGTGASAAPGIVSAVPDFGPASQDPESPTGAGEQPAGPDEAETPEGDADPQAAADADSDAGSGERPTAETGVAEPETAEPATAAGESPARDEPAHDSADHDAAESATTASDGPDARDDDANADADTMSAERPMVGAAFGIGVKTAGAHAPEPARFDDLLHADPHGSQHVAPSALILTRSPGVASLSGPVTSTGEVLITGTYELPEGLGSHGHVLGATDGKEADAVLIDGELAPVSSPTPIAASAAVSTSKPAGEVIRPPAPDKGNKLMLTLAIVAGGLALVLAATLIIAFTTNVF